MRHDPSGNSMESSKWLPRPCSLDWCGHKTVSMSQGPLDLWSELLSKLSLLLDCMGSHPGCEDSNSNQKFMDFSCLSISFLKFQLQRPSFNFSIWLPNLIGLQLSPWSLSPTHIMSWRIFLRWSHLVWFPWSKLTTYLVLPNFSCFLHVLTWIYLFIYYF